MPTLSRTIQNTRENRIFLLSEIVRSLVRIITDGEDENSKAGAMMPRPYLTFDR